MEQTTKNMKIMITGVHSTPALAVLEELQSRGYEDFVWVGQKYSMMGNTNTTMEYKTINGKGIKFISLITGKIQRKLDFSFFQWIIRIPIGFVQALFVLLSHKPKIVMIFGSHIGVPISFWSWVLRIPVIDHEQTVTQGLANQFISKFSTKVLFSWKNTYHENNKYIYTGNPFSKNKYDVMTDNIKFENTDKKTILFTAGSQGSHLLNQTVINIIDRLTKKYNIIHQTGTNPIADDFQIAQDKANVVNKDGVKYIPLVNYSGGEVFAKSNLIVGRSGANTVYEIIALKKIALFIPIPFTYKDEQTKNALMLVNAGTAKLLKQEVLTVDTIFSSIEDIFSKYETMVAATESAKNNLIVMDADKKISDIIEEVLNQSKKTNPIQDLFNKIPSEKDKIEIPITNNDNLNSEPEKLQEITQESSNTEIIPEEKINEPQNENSNLQTLEVAEKKDKKVLNLNDIVIENRIFKSILDKSNNLKSTTYSKLKQAKGKMKSYTSKFKK